MAASVIAICVGLPRDLGNAASTDPMDKPWRSGFVKRPVEGPVEIVGDNLVGDGQEDLVHHGGADKAILAYAATHYATWRDERQTPGWPHGAFGENLTIDGQDESSVCVGDVYRIGSATLQVSQPRQPCWKLGRHLRDKSLPARVIETGRSGWYLRVIEPGTLRAGDAVTLMSRTHPEWTITRLQRAYYEEKHDRELARTLMHLEVLAMSWRTVFAGRADAG